MPNGYQRMWTVIRGLRVFTSRDVEQLAEVRKDAAKKYIHALMRAGYLKVVGKVRPGPMGAPLRRYRLLKDTGPRHPVYCWRTGVLRDPNTGEVRRWAGSKS